MTTTSGPTQAQIDAAARHLLDGTERLRRLPAHEAARAALGPSATDAQLDAWISMYRPSEHLARTGT